MNNVTIDEQCKRVRIMSNVNLSKLRVSKKLKHAPKHLRKFMKKTTKTQHFSPSYRK